MMERWLQVTCDGCGETDCNTAPNQTVALYREEMRGYGWRKVGPYDYCRQCVAAGISRKSETIFKGEA